MKKKNLLLLVFLLLSALVTAQKIAPMSLYALAEKQDANTHALVLDHQIQMEQTAFNKVRIIETQDIVVFSPKGTRFVEDVVYYNQFTTVKSLDVQHFDAGGKLLRKYKKSDFSDLSIDDGFSLYTDGRVKHLRFIPQQYPYRYVFSTVKETTNTALLPDYRPVSGYGLAVQNAQLSWRFPADVGARVLIKGPEPSPLKIQQTDTEITLSLSAFAALKEEPLSPGFREIFPWARLACAHFSLAGHEGKASNWQELGHWMYHNLYHDRAELSDKTKAELKELTANLTTDREKITAVYSYLQDKTRYVSVQLGIGGFQPMQALKVDEVRYGDCKALSNYMHAMLKSIGIKSSHVVIFSDAETRGVDPDFSSVNQGNHMILCVPSSNNMWLECTSNDYPPGFIGYGNHNRSVFVFDERGGRVMNTPNYDQQQNIQHTSAQWLVDADGSLTGTVNRTHSGLFFSREIRLLEMKKDELHSEMMNRYGFIKGFEYGQLSNEKNPLQAELRQQFEVAVSDYAERITDRLIIRASVLHPERYIPERVRNRTTDFELNMSAHKIEEHTFRIPHGAAISSLPEPIHIESPFGTYQMKVSLLPDGQLHYYRSLETVQGRFPSSEYEAYRSFCTQVHSAELQKIILTLVKP